MPKGCTPIEKILPREFLDLSNEKPENFGNTEYSSENNELVVKNDGEISEQSAVIGDEIDQILSEVSENSDEESGETSFLDGIKNNIWTILILIIIFMVVSSSVVLNLFSNHMPNFGLTKNCLDGTLSPTFQGNLIIGSIIAIIFTIIKKLVPMK